MAVRGQCTGASVGPRPTTIREIEELESTMSSLESQAPGDMTTTAQLITERGKWAEVTERLRSFDYKENPARVHAEEDRVGRLMA